MKKLVLALAMVLGAGNLYAQEAVDLGLSVKWADRNVGASSPRDVGNFYAWGELETKSSFTSDNYYANDIKEPSYDEDSNKRYYYREWGIAGSKNDVARQKLTYWRMPNVDEFKELRDHCQFDIYHDFEKDEFYCIVTGPNGNTITLPVVGYMTGTEHSQWPMRCIYWSSNEGRDFCLSPQNKFIGITSDVKRYYGCLVRPIRNFSKGEIGWKQQKENNPDVMVLLHELRGYCEKLEKTTSKVEKLDYIQRADALCEKIQKTPDAGSIIPLDKIAEIRSFLANEKKQIK